MCFTSYDPIEDTERSHFIRYSPLATGFTSYDPIEDTESRRSRIWPPGSGCFTSYDPIEDTESHCRLNSSRFRSKVSPATIRLRILKVHQSAVPRALRGVSPATIRLRILKVCSNWRQCIASGVSPATIRLRILKDRLQDLLRQEHVQFHQIRSD